MMLYFLICSVTNASQFITNILGIPHMFIIVCQNLYTPAHRSLLTALTACPSAVSLEIYFHNVRYLFQSVAGKSMLKNLLNSEAESLISTYFLGSKNFKNSQSPQSQASLDNTDTSLVMFFLIHKIPFNHWSLGTLGAAFRTAIFDSRSLTNAVFHF